MAELDLAIRGGTLVDGTGTPGTRGDLGIRDGKIVAVGEVVGEAKKEIDAAGCVVAPGAWAWTAMMVHWIALPDHERVRRADIVLGYTRTA